MVTASPPAGMCRLSAREEGFNAVDPYLYRAPNQELAQQQMLLVMGILASNPDKKDWEGRLWWPCL